MKSTDAFFCPQCHGPLVRVGEFWICTQHGQVTPRGSRVRKRLFISYGHDEHVSLAKRLRDDLRARNHEVWFDEDRLRPGYDWEVFIEQGLAALAADKGNSAVLILLTPQSVRRPDGYCLNEIARALGRSIRIIPLMVQDSEPPLSICRIQWLDLRECLPISDHETTYHRRFERLLQAIEEDALDFEGMQQRLIKVLQPLEFCADVARAAKLVGRQWVFTALEEWLAGPADQRVFWITGAPGVGKTALAVAITNRFPQVLAWHLCKVGHVQKSDPRRVVTSIAYQLSTQLPCYAERLAALDIEQLVQDDSGTLFDNLIVQQMARLSKPDQPVVIMIDALDEATVEGRNELAGFIAAEFPRTPQWLRLIVTSRPDQAVSSPLQDMEAFPLDDSAGLNRKDIDDYLENELGPLLARRDDKHGLIERVSQKCAGVFMYAESICHGLRMGCLSIDRLDELPKELGGLLWRFVQRQWPDLRYYRQVVRPALRAILAAREPLPVMTLQKLLDWEDEEFADMMRSLGALFTLATEDSRVVVQPYHRALAEWLADETHAGPYFVSAREGHRLLADHFWQEYQQHGVHTDAAMLRHGLAHLRLAGALERVFALAEDAEFVGRFLALASSEALRREMAAAWATAVAEDTAGTIAREHPASAHFAHGLHLVTQGQFTEAIGVLRRGGRESASLGALLIWTEVCWLAKDHLPLPEATAVITEGTQALSDALRQVGVATGGVLGIEVARTIGWMLKDMVVPAESLAAFAMAVDRSERLGNPRQLALSLRDLGCWYRDAHDFESARASLERSVRGFRALSDDRQLAISLRDLGLLELEMVANTSLAPNATSQSAVIRFQESLHCLEMLGDMDMAAWSMRYLGLAAARCGELEAARDHLDRASALFFQFRDTNIALSQFCAQHVAEIRRPVLMERFGHSHLADADFAELL